MSGFLELRHQDKVRSANTDWRLMFEKDKREKKQKYGYGVGFQAPTCEREEGRCGSEEKKHEIQTQLWESLGQLIVRPKAKFAQRGDSVMLGSNVWVLVPHPVKSLSGAILGKRKTNNKRPANAVANPEGTAGRCPLTCWPASYFNGDSRDPPLACHSNILNSLFSVLIVVRTITFTFCL